MFTHTRICVPVYIFIETYTYIPFSTFIHYIGLGEHEKPLESSSVVSALRKF